VLDMLSEPSSVTHEISIEQLDELERHTPPPTVAKAQPVITAAGPAVTAGRSRYRGEWAADRPTEGPAPTRVAVLLVLLGLLAGGAGYYLYSPISSRSRSRSSSNPRVRLC